MTGLREVWAVFAVRLLLGAARTFAMLSSQTITPNLVHRSVFPNAVSTNSSSGYIATIGNTALICCFDLPGATTFRCPDRRGLPIGLEGLRLLRTAPAFGAALTAIVLAFYSISRHFGVWLFSNVVVFGISIIVFGLSTWPYLSLLALICMGTGDMASVYMRHMLVQMKTPDQIQRRVSAVNVCFIGASNELGEFELDVTAVWFPLWSLGVRLRLPLRVCGSGFSHNWRNRIFWETRTAIDLELSQLRILAETAETTDRNMDKSWDSIEKSEPHDVELQKTDSR